MDLGNILAREGNTPLTGRIVKFMIQGQSEGVIVSALASARLIPITAEEQRTVRSEATAFVYAVDENGKRLRPKLNAEDVEEEFVWRFLARVLRDEDDVKKPFATATRLRQCLIVQQVEYLQREYDLMLADHYPELLGLIPTGNRDEIVGLLGAGATAGVGIGHAVAEKGINVWEHMPKWLGGVDKAQPAAAAQATATSNKDVVAALEKQPKEIASAIAAELSKPTYRDTNQSGSW